MNPSPKVNTSFLPLDIYGDTQRIMRIYYWFATVILGAQLLGILIVLGNHEYQTATIIAISILLVLAALFFIRSRYFEWASTFLAMVLLIFVTAVATIGQGIHHISNLGYPAILILASLVTKKRTMIFLTLFTIGCIAWLVFGEILGAYTPTPMSQSIPGDFFTASLVILTTAFMVRMLSEALFQSNLRLQKELRERSLIEESREALIKELEIKNAELERFTYTVSHDLKSPLITINGFLGYLEKDAASNNIDRLKQDTLRISEAVHKMHTLLNELLELSRIGRLMNPPEAVPFASLVHDAMDAVQGQLQARQVKVLLQPGLPDVYGDRQRLTEALQNLIDNAVKFMGDQADPHIEVGVAGEEDGKSVFYVRDNGIGIVPEFHDHVFGLFNKLDSKTEGTGIGLTIVKRIIEVHGGRIWIESEPGKGATFFFTLERR
jgi:signal transduction histidine kinase